MHYVEFCCVHFAKLEGFGNETAFIASLARVVLRGLAAKQVPTGWATLANLYSAYPLRLIIG